MSAYLVIDNHMSSEGRPKKHFELFMQKARARIHAEESLGVIKEQANLYIQEGLRQMKEKGVIE
jgi:hypothetical protein